MQNQDRPFLRTRKNTMINTIKLIVLTTFLSLLAIVPVQAAEEENDGIAQLIMITPKAGHEEALVEAIT